MLSEIVSVLMRELERLKIRQDEMELQMSAIADELTKVKANLDATQADVTTLSAGVDSLNAKIAALQAAAGSDQLSPTTQAALDALATEGANLNTTADAAAAKIPTA